ncbi:phosphate-selective porin OprO/OprP [Dysgonomonas hofstadii]|uniref:Phosphate-selective porin OprO/OprP n=1 Tax=Dysgonomonas hofstadii TaxID=637886 RepID=A0A840CHZ7_9BACT|nr:porin [Dysgonomonas hofstadii]MBB4035637.1 phosphate-selective porin OprO/OprP [Dysgonomonas hofstadii]
MKKKTKYKRILLYITVLASLSVSAQSVDVKIGNGDDDKIKISSMGRIYFDGAAYIEDETELSNGVAIPDVRLGLKAVYKKWDAKLDFGYANSKASAKDIHLRYSFNKNSSIKLGHYGEMFGYESWESTSTVKFNGKTPSTAVFESGRRIGIVYSMWQKKYWLAAGIYGDGDAINNTTQGDDGYAATGRLLYTPFKEDGKILHIGLSGTIRKADANGFDSDGKDNPRSLTYSSYFGTTSIDRNKPLSATISDADYQAKYNAEILGSYGPVFLLGEYYHSNVKRKSALPTYKASGGYVMAGFLAIGDSYSYNSADGRMRLPKPGSLEILARYDYIDLDDNNTGIYGGRMSDWSVGLNYYINKFVTVKGNYSNIKLGNRSVIAAGETVHAIQARVMVLF